MCWIGNSSENGNGDNSDSLAMAMAMHGEQVKEKKIWSGRLVERSFSLIILFSRAPNMANRFARPAPSCVWFNEYILIFKSLFVNQNDDADDTI